MSFRQLLNTLGCVALLIAFSGCKDRPSAETSPEEERQNHAEPNQDGHEQAVHHPGDEQPSTHGSKPSEHDPVKMNGPIFVDWPKPKLAIFFSGWQHGYMEPCGCAGLENMKGGLGRRHTLLREQAEAGWPVVALDLGGMVRRAGPQAVIKFQRTQDALKTMKYQAVGFDHYDLQLPTAEVLAMVPEDEPTPFVAANVGLYDLESDFVAPYRVIEQGGMKLGVTSIVGAEQLEKLQNEDVVSRDPADALREVLPKLEAEKCDKLVLLANTTRKAAEQLAADFPQFDVVVVPSDYDPPAKDADLLEGTDTRLIELSHKGMYVGVLAFFDEGERVRFQRVPVDHRFTDSKAMKELIVAYQAQLREAGRQGLSLQPIPHPSGDTFVGSESCKACHAEEYEIWKEGPHAHAFETLTKLNPPRQFDPECISCHVTGWEPQQYSPLDSGFVSFEKTPHLINNGCENCHGPGARHVAAQTAYENDDSSVSEEDLERLVEQMRLTSEDAKQHRCVQCHDLDNDPGFDYDKKWPLIEH